MSVYLSVVVPLYNEEKSVKDLFSNLVGVLEGCGFSYEIIFVDDGSKDKTWEIIEELKEGCLKLRGIKFRGNYGQTSAMEAGFESASGEIIVTMDGDLQNDAADIPILLERMAEGYDIVSGGRKDRKDSFLRVLVSRAANFVISFTTGVRLHDYGCSLKAYRGDCIRSLKAYAEMHRFLPALASMTGARVTEVEVKHHPRRYGVSKYGFKRVPKVFVDIFTLNLLIRFSSMPLKGFALWAIPFLTMSCFFVALGVLGFIFQWKSGKSLFFMISAALSGMAVVHLIVLGILGELVVGMSDLTYTQMAEVTKKTIKVNGDDK